MTGTISLLNFRGVCKASCLAHKVNRSRLSYFHQSRRDSRRKSRERNSRPKHVSSPLANSLVNGAAVERFSHDQNSNAQEIDGIATTSKTLFANLLSLYRFSRPHTMLGTFVSVTSISLLALGSRSFDGPVILSFLQALVSALLMNICIVGINQIYDIEIDRINKPYLPLAAGDFSLSTGIWIVLSTALVALVIGLMSKSIPLILTLTGSLLLGIAYSTDLPFLRWKRHPLAAAMCILSVRAILVQLGFFFHMQQALGITAIKATPSLMFATGFMLVFSIVIALMKDIPDVAGDKNAGLQTLSVRLGQKQVFWLCIGLLELAYACAMCMFLVTDLNRFVRFVGASGHAIVGILVWLRAAKTNLNDSQSIYNCYMDVWKAFYVEYLFLPLLGQ